MIGVLSSSRDELLSAVREVAGVIAAGVEPDETGEPAFLRIDLADDADEQTLRDAVEQLLRERFSVYVDGSGSTLVETLQPLDRAGELRAERLSVQRGRDGLFVEVEVSRGAQTVPGRVQRGPQDSDADAVAEAVLLALEELTEDAVIGQVETVEGLSEGGPVRVTLRLDVDGEERAAEGSAQVLEDPRLGVLEATFAAVEPHLPAA